MYTRLSVLVFVLFLELASSETILESRIVPCGTEDEDVLGVDLAKNPMRLASSFKGPVKFDLKLYSKCHKMLLFTITVSSPDSSKNTLSNTLVLVNHAKNSLTKKASRFGIPVVVKLHQDKTFQKYHVKRLYTVNGKMMEEVMNIERNKSYLSCNNIPGTLSPTCGYFRGPGTEVAGFCCSCKDHKNNVQQRGGQRCDIPGKTEDQLTSAHCLRPSPFTYNVYEIQQPELYHSMTFEVFVGERWTNGSLTWKRISASGHGVRVDTENDMAASGALQVSYRPHLGITSHSPNVFSPSSQRLLVPIQNHEENEHIPEPLKGPAETQMLIVPKSLMSPHGAFCDRVGTGIGAFLNQKEPCRQERFSCLKNQPFDLWKQDQGPRGPSSTKFKVSSYRSSENEISPFADIFQGLEEGSLYAEHPTLAPTKVFIEMPANDIILLNPGYNAFIEYALTETGKNGATVVTQVVNNEVVGTSFSIELKECSIDIFGEGMSERERKLAAPSQIIGPLDAKYFSIDIHSDVISQKVYCYILLINEHGESIAAREVTFSPKETCLCVHTCKCLCGEQNSKCTRLGDEGIVAAGLHWEIMTPNKSSKRQSKLTTRRMEWIMHFVILIHVLVILIAMIVWLVKKYWMEKGKGDNESNSSQGSDEEEEEEEMIDGLNSSRSSDGSDVTLFKREGKGSEHQRATPSQTGGVRRDQTHHNLKVKFSDTSIHKDRSMPELTQTQSKVQNSPSTLAVPETNVTNGHHSPENDFHTVQMLMLETDADSKEGGQSLNNNDTFNWEKVNNNESRSDNNIDAFYNFCASVSSSRTSFGTVSRRKRDQFSAYDFLPEPKHKGSGLLD